MPHQCTTCGQTFDDGSKEMLSGCPECGGNKFQYLPSDVLQEQDTDVGSSRQTVSDERPSPPDDDTGVTEAVGRAATTVRDYVARRGSTDADRSETTTDRPDSAESSSTPASTPADEPDDAEAMPSEADDEDAAQASARGEMVDRSDLPEGAVAGGGGPPSEGRVVKHPDSDDDVDRPALEELRQELNEQFESIRIVAPGQYELNLMELYDREEYIIALQEDGRYVIQVPESWRGDE